MTGKFTHERKIQGTQNSFFYSRSQEIIAINFCTSSRGKYQHFQVCLESRCVSDAFFWMQVCVCPLKMGTLRACTWLLACPQRRTWALEKYTDTCPLPLSYPRTGPVASRRSTGPHPPHPSHFSPAPSQGKARIFLRSS